MADHDGFAIGQRVLVHPGSRQPRPGTIVEDFGDESGLAVAIGGTRIAEPSRRWAVQLDAGNLILLTALTCDAPANGPNLRPVHTL